MSIQTFINTYGKHYHGWRRILAHVVFWLIIFFYEAVQTSFTIESTDTMLLFTLREVLTIMLVHYFLAYYAIPKFLLKAWWVYFLLSVVLSYVILMAGLYYSVYFIQASKAVAITEDFSRMASFVLKYDFLTTLVDIDRMYSVFGFNLSLIFSLLIKTVISFYFSNIQKLTLEKENIELEKEKTELELSFLKAQVNPHFFFNTLNNIYSLIEDKDAVAANIVLKLSDLMRYSLYESNHAQIPLVRELRFIQDYVNLEKIRHKEHVVIDVDFPPVSSGLIITPLILIAFVENAFKHGINNTIDASWVKISASVEGNTLIFTVKNSKPHKLRKEVVQGGIGLVNARRRLDLLYANQYTLAVQNQPTFYNVHLTLTLHEDSPEMRDHRRRTPRAKPHSEVY